jgi:hypothetical protein
MGDGVADPLRAMGVTHPDRLEVMSSSSYKTVSNADPQCVEVLHCSSFDPWDHTSVA